MVKAKGAIVAGFALALGALWLAPAGIKQAPALELSIIDGRTLRLAELRGRPVLVTFWATTCAGCIREIPHLVNLYEELGPQGLEIIGIAMYYDPPNQVVEMTRRREIPYPVALDVQAEAARAFGNVRLTPSNFLIAPDGQIIRQKIGEFSESEFVELRSAIREMLQLG